MTDCSKCGTATNAGDVVCGKCGDSLDDGTAEVKTQASNAKPVPSKMKSYLLFAILFIPLFAIVLWVKSAIHGHSTSRLVGHWVSDAPGCVMNQITFDAHKFHMEGRFNLASTADIDRYDEDGEVVRVTYTSRGSQHSDAYTFLNDDEIHYGNGICVYHRD